MEQDKQGRQDKRTANLQKRIDGKKEKRLKKVSQGLNCSLRKTGSFTPLP